jgi:heat shock protein HslJ
VGPSWTVDSIVAGDAVSSVPGVVVATLQFGADGRVEVATGCNEGRGTYRADPDTITFDDIAVTDMACEAAAGSMEAAVLAVLGAGTVPYAIDASASPHARPGLILRASRPPPAAATRSLYSPRARSSR